MLRMCVIGSNIVVIKEIIFDVVLFLVGWFVIVVVVFVFFLKDVVKELGLIEVGFEFGVWVGIGFFV